MNIKRIVRGISRRIHSCNTYITNRFERRRLKNAKFILISNNCWGYSLYGNIGRPYNTPFVGLFLFPECYIKFLENFENCINLTVTFTDNSRYIQTTPGYPIGILPNGIEIHFMHYKTRQEALDKWNRRMQRLKESMERNTPIFIKFCDRDGCEYSHLQRFHKLNFKNKISIGIRIFNSKNHVYTPKLEDPQCGCALSGNLLYIKRYHYFDITEWILSGQIHRTLWSRLFSLVD
ncbi:DUF1919 domain-containing protein [Desulfovibrio sp.]|uniref:DUF1919 domain-containing protein n=1 Tax=Desulfovibrio sp. TaxID=885 RepID=UPI0039E6A032